MVGYSEIFNKQSNKFKVYVTYTANPALEIKHNGDAYDLVYASSIYHKDLLPLFVNLRTLISRGRISGSQIYPNLLETYRYQRRIPLIPAAFDLHVFMTPQSAEKDPKLTISFSELMEANKEFSLQKDGIYSRIAFSPLWSPNLFYHYLEDNGCLLSTWGKNDFNVDSSLALSLLSKFKADFEKSFPLKDTPGEKQFREKYLYDNGFSLLNSQKILYHDTEFSEMLRLPLETREKYRFYYYSECDRLTTEPDVLFFALLRSSPSKRNGKEFIRWFFKSETQEKLLLESEKNWLNSLGISGRLSSVIDTNEKLLCQIYPDLTLRLPPPHGVYGAQPKPEGWENLTAQILDSWVEQNLHSDVITSFPMEAVQLWLAEQQQ